MTETKKRCPHCGRLVDEIRDLPDYDLPMCADCRDRAEARDYGFGGYEPRFPEDDF